MVDYFRDKGIEALGIVTFGPIDVKKDSPTRGMSLDTPKLAWAHCNFAGPFRERWAYRSASTLMSMVRASGK